MKLVFQNAILECLDICNFSKMKLVLLFIHQNLCMKKYLINPLDWYKIGYKEQDGQ